MQAIVQDEYGTKPEAVLRLAEIAKPTIGDDEVLVRVRRRQRRHGHVALHDRHAVRDAPRRLRRPRAEGLQPGPELSPERSSPSART